MAMRIPLMEFCEITGQSRQNVDNKVKQGKLVKEKDQKGNVFILLDINAKEYVNEGEKVNEIAEIKDLFGRFFGEYKGAIDKLQKSHEREVETIKKSNEEIVKMKDERLKEHNEAIKKRDEQIDELITKLTEKEKGFFRKLFGGK